MQLRFLQTVVEIAAENNSTTLFPIPIELFKPFTDPGKPASEEARARALKAAAETMIEALPKTGDPEMLKGAAQQILKEAAGARSRRRRPGRGGGLRPYSGFGPSRAWDASPAGCAKR
jgi:hypothetical protein